MKKNKKLILKKDKVVSLSDSQMANVNGGKEGQESTNRNFTCGLCTGDHWLSTGGTSIILLTTTNL